MIVRFTVATNGSLPEVFRATKPHQILSARDSGPNWVSSALRGLSLQLASPLATKISRRSLVHLCLFALLHFVVVAAILIALNLTQFRGARSLATTTNEIAQYGALEAKEERRYRG